jgi:maleylpyruvate isomerase
MSRPEEAIAAVDEAYAMLRRATIPLTDAAVRGASLLPGWTRAHVLTHLARNADGNAFIVAGAAFGEQWPQYPGGPDQRVADIDAGAGRGVTELLEDLERAQARLVAAFDHVPDDNWSIDVVSWRPDKLVVADVPRSRRREILVHLVDMDVGVKPRDLPADFVESNRDWLAENRTTDTWPDAPW